MHTSMAAAPAGSTPAELVTAPAWATTAEKWATDGGVTFSRKPSTQRPVTVMGKPIDAGLELLQEHDDTEPRIYLYDDGLPLAEARKLAAAVVELVEVAEQHHDSTHALAVTRRGPTPATTDQPAAQPRHEPEPPDGPKLTIIVRTARDQRRHQLKIAAALFASHVSSIAAAWAVWA